MAENERKLGKDLRLRFDEVGADLMVTDDGDLETIADEDNLAQAIIARLSTEREELYDIGHAAYGSRLHDVIGEVNSEAVRQRIKVLVRECLVQERRIKEIVSIHVLPDLHDQHRVNIEMTFLPIEGKVYLTVIYPFRLEV